MIDIYEVVKKLIGSVEPIGSTHVDNASFENLEKHIDLTHKLILDIDEIVIKNKDFQEISIKRVVDRSKNFLNSLEDFQT